MHIDPQSMLYNFLDRLYEESNRHKFDYLLLETSGGDNAEYLAQLFFLAKMPYHYRLGSYITLVDAEYGHLNLDEFPVARDQVAYADVIVINKVDLADKATVQNLERRIKKINSMARILYAAYGRTNLSDVLNISLYDQLKGLQYNLCKGGEDFYMDGISTTVLSESRPMNKEKLDAWIQNLFIKHGEKILRSKGFFNIAGSDYRHEFQAVRKTFHAKTDTVWGDDEERKSIVVLIGKELPDDTELQKSFSNCQEY